MLQEGVPAFSVEQPEEGMAMLKQRAVERQVRCITTSKRTNIE